MLPKSRLLKLVMGCCAAVMLMVVLSTAQAQSQIDFGNNMHPGANNGICSDARFTGPKTQRSGQSRNQTHQDAADCRALYESGEIECFSRRRCAAISLETQYRNLDVRGALIEDRSNGLAPADRAMIYVEPQGTRGSLEFTAIDGIPVRNKKIALFSPGSHSIEVKWLSPRTSFFGDTGSASGFPDSLENRLRFTGILEFEIDLEAGKYYRIYPAHMWVSEASLVVAPIESVGEYFARSSDSQGFETLAIWVVDAETGEMILDQRKTSESPE